MKAIYIDHHSSLDELKVSEIPVPSIGPNDVLVKVEAAGINPSDVASVEGKFSGSILPRVVGRDFAGSVVEGPKELLGAAVWGSGGDLGILRDGTQAEFLSIPRQGAARRPEKLIAEEAAAAGVPFITAFSSLIHLGNLKPGEWVIISGAAGSVGQAAIQIASAKGAHIIALVRGASESWIAQSRNVEAVAQSDQNNLNQIVREKTSGNGADLAINAVGAAIFPELLEALALKGRLVLFSAAGGREATLDIQEVYKNELAVFGLDTQKLNATACAAILGELAPLFDSGALKPPKIVQRFPLSKAADAYKQVATGKSGKVIFAINGD